MIGEMEGGWEKGVKEGGRGTGKESAKVEGGWREGDD